MLEFFIKNYLYIAISIASIYEPKVVEHHFKDISKLSRNEAWKIKPKGQANDQILF